METRSRSDTIRTLIIGDIDGVVADCSERLCYIKGEKKNWDKFYGAEMANDKLRKPVADLLKGLAQGSKNQLVFLTGRPERTKELTRLWLKEHFTSLLDWWVCCRHDGDHRKSPEVKAEMLSQFLNNYYTLFEEDLQIYIFDDDPENLKAMERVVQNFGLGCEYETFCVGTERI